MTERANHKENSLAWRRKRFLDGYRKHHAVGRAARYAGISRRQVYRWIENSKEFAQEFEDVKREVIEQLEMEADRRAMKGVRKPVFYQGLPVGHIQEYSDSLLMFRLKALDPEKYRERHEVSGPDGGPIQIKEVIVNLTE
ncbi:MAG: hypothetical protein A2158_01600 [Chloroflexi bacterium RBG_13_46_14]|nr:MAG: hypothetical protein A2158_01600 [Chloroflexi bacterium RBG_13_46_14]